jgi:hypothetical protein
MPGHRSAARALLFTATAITGIALPSHAQSAGDGFLFHPPAGSWTFRGGVTAPTANSDVFAQVTDQLTIDRLDFASATFGTSLAIRLSGENDLVIDVGYSNVSHGSDFRHWLDQNDQPIEQTTSLRRIPVTLGLRHYVTPRGRAIGQFAWIPARRALYVGVGGGMMEYKFRQAGDFVDFRTLNVAYDEFVSQAWTPAAHAAAGLDITLGSFTMLTAEARYTWAKAPMSSDFQDFNKIDLSGPSVTAGLTFRLY